MSNIIITPDIIAFEMFYICKTLKLGVTDLHVSFPDRQSYWRVSRKARKRKTLKVAVNLSDWPFTDNLDDLRPYMTAVLVTQAGAA